MELINKKENIFGDDIAFVEQYDFSIANMSVEKQKFEKCRWSMADELEDRYCVCDTSASCGECISISEVCNSCEDFYSEIEQDNLFRGNGELI